MIFGPKIGIICRFNSPKEQKKVLEDLATGQIDIFDWYSCYF